jgi:trigger factor
MNIQVEAVGPARKQVNIQVPADEVSEAFNNATSMYQKHARIPGFRPGKAPVNLVRNRFSKDINKEVKDFLLPRAYQGAIKQEKLDVVQIVDVTDSAPVPGEPFTISVTVDVKPDFELPDYKSIRIEPQPAEVTEESIDEVVKNMQDRMATYEEQAGRKAEKGDRVMISYEATVDGAPMADLDDNLRLLAKADEIGVVLDPNYAFIPEFVEALPGTVVDDQKDIEVKFADEFIEKSLAGKTAMYSVKVLKVEAKKLPDLDEAFFKSVGAESLEGFRTRIRDDLARMKVSDERRRVEGEVAKKLQEMVDMNLPQSELQRHTSNEVFDLVQYNTSRGLARETIEGNREEIFNTAAKTAEQRLKLRYILLKIAEAEKLSVSGSDVEDHIRYLAQRSRKDLTKFKAELKKNDVMDDVREDVMVSKAMDFLMALQQPEAAGAST